MLDLAELRRRWAATPWTGPNDATLSKDMSAIFAELGRLTAELAAAQGEMTAARRGPVVEWRQIRDFWRAEMGDMMLTVHEDGWQIRVLDIEMDEWVTIKDGNETGPEGKDKCEAAYQRMAGLSGLCSCAPQQRR